jgi:hypothetical protein
MLKTSDVCAHCGTPVVAGRMRITASALCEKDDAFNGPGLCSYATYTNGSTGPRTVDPINWHLEVETHSGIVQAVGLLTDASPPFGATGVLGSGQRTVGGPHERLATPLGE